LPEDLVEARSVLTRLAHGSLVFGEAITLLERIQKLQIADLEEQRLAAIKQRRLQSCTGASAARPTDDAALFTLLSLQRRAQGLIQILEPVADLPLKPCTPGDKWNLVAGAGASASHLPGAPTNPMPTELQMAQTELEHLRRRLQGVSSSKFWKMRSAWFRVKRRLRLTREQA